MEEHFMLSIACTPDIVTGVTQAVWYWRCRLDD